MSLPRDWAAGLPEEIAKRYRQAAVELYRSPLGKDADKADLALDVAIGFCERARAYGWPELEELERRAALVEDWQVARNGARRMARVIGGIDGIFGAAIVDGAMRRSGVTLRAPGMQPQEAAAEFLRELARRDLRLIHGGGVFRFGPISFAVPHGTRAKGLLPQGPQRTPAKTLDQHRRAIAVILALTHLFRCISRVPAGEQVEIRHGETIAGQSGSPCWEAARVFAIAAFPTADDADANADADADARANATSEGKGKTDLIGNARRWQARRKPIYRGFPSTN